MPVSELLTIAEFIRWGRIGRTKMYEEINAGNLPAVKVGRRTFIKCDDAIAWLHKQPFFIAQCGQ